MKKKKEICITQNGKTKCYDPKKITITSNHCNIEHKDKPLKWVGMVVFISSILLLSMGGLFLRNYFNVDGRTDVNLMNYNTTIIYKTEEDPLSIQISPNIEDNITTITLGDQSFQCDSQTGKVLGIDYYSPLWIPVNNSYASENTIGKGHQIGSVYSLYDPIGIFGKGEQYYTIEVISNMLWWTTEPKLIGVQHSLLCHLYINGSYYVGDVIIDSTSGILEEYEDITLSDYGSYPSSRHRLFIFALMSIVMMVVALFAFLYKKKKRRNPKYFISLSVGLIATFIELMVDVWFYAWFTIYGVIAIHFSFALILLIFTERSAFVKRTSFIFPIILEFIVYGLASFLLGEPTPQVIAFIPSLIIASMIFSRDGIGFFSAKGVYKC